MSLKVNLTLNSDSYLLHVDVGNCQISHLECINLKVYHSHCVSISDVSNRLEMQKDSGSGCNVVLCTVY